jgi:glycosyltransferase involved in cell wall biosynthesis
MPKVSFVIPCYKLAHFLPQCVHSILEQTNGDFEILIMDDCSPDNTPEVAQSFSDTRVKHIRNDPNLGHLRNYNKGIALASGEYIWLISADDRLRKPYALERYLQVMDQNPQVGFAFCSGLGLEDEQETQVIDWAFSHDQDIIFPGREFLYRLLDGNCVLAPSGLVRKKCYEKLGEFPLDLPFAGDWYLWCIFALHYDVAFFAEPMVNYRQHSGSMTEQLLAEDVRLIYRDDLAVLWRIYGNIRQFGDNSLANHCRDQIVARYTRYLSSKQYRGVKYQMDLEELDDSLNIHLKNLDERKHIKKTVMEATGNLLYYNGYIEDAMRFYKLAIDNSIPDFKLWLKYAILYLGPMGLLTMRLLSGIRALSR